MYAVSNTGNVINVITGKTLSLSSDKDGYPVVSVVSKSLKHRSLHVHRLVAWEYCENDDLIHKTQVDHIDGVKQNNDYRNLEWVTPRENTLRAERLGLRNVRGSSNGNSKFDEAFITSLCERLASGESKMSIIRSFNPDHPRMDNKENRRMYTLLDRLLKKELWPDISSKYTFPRQYRDVPESTPGTGDFRYDEELIHLACELLDTGHSKKGTAFYISSFMDGPEDQDKKFDLALEMIQRLITGKSWNYITSQYENLKNARPTSRFAFIDESKVCSMYDNGYSREEIAKEIGVNPSNKELKFILYNYRKSKGIGKGQDFQLND